MSGNRFLITQSLLSSWLWMCADGEALSLSDVRDGRNCRAGRDSMRDFLRVLRREPTRPNRAMLDGQQFENMVTAYCEGSAPPEDHLWRDGIVEVGEIVRGSRFQVAAYRDAQIDGIHFLLYGRLDALRAGTIYDIKFSRSYREPGKYFDSPQHPMYFACVPEARRFDYVVYTGKEVCVESYRPQDAVPIERTISQFVKFLEATGLDRIYIEKWRAK